jgi:hypothetical protein
MASAGDSVVEDVDGGAQPARERPLGRNAPLVPVASIAGRALVTVIAIMTFLAALTAGGAQLLADASSGWRSAIAREVTIQVRPIVGRPVDADVERAAALAREQPGVTGVKVYSKEESERLLEPWLGSGLNLDELPVPRIVVVSISPRQPPDFAAFRQRLAEIKGVSLDDHRLWVQRLAAMANAIVLLALALVGLVIVATALAVAFATRGRHGGQSRYSRCCISWGRATISSPRSSSITSCAWGCGRRHWRRGGVGVLRRGRRNDLELGGDAGRRSIGGAVRLVFARALGLFCRRGHRAARGAGHGGRVAGHRPPHLARARLTAGACPQVA